MRACIRSERHRGAVAVEMALILPVFMALIFGIIEASRLGMVTQLLHVAAREGCRTAVLPGQTEAAVRARVDAALVGSGITPLMVISSPSGAWQTAPAPSRITVHLSVPFDQVSWLGDPFAFGGKGVEASATMSSEKDD